MNQGRLCLDEVKKCGTHVLIISVTLEVTMFHLSLTVMLSFRTLYSCLKLSKCFRILALVKSTFKPIAIYDIHCAMHFVFVVVGTNKSNSKVYHRNRLRF